MQTKYGFTAMSVAEFQAWLPTISVTRTLARVQEHHTWSPAYVHFNGANHFELQRGMKAHHVGNNGWSDIGQHFTIFPDGVVMTGRPLANTPACIFNRNAGSICIENLGNFDQGHDAMTTAQRDAIVAVTAALLKRFGLGAPDTDNVVYHHWYDLNTGARTNGLSGSTKSCPGTAFFGGNMVPDCETNFLPLVAAAMGVATPPPPVDRYARVTSATLTIRSGPGTANPPVPGIPPAKLGTILRVYEEKSGWLRISATKQEWVSGAYTATVTRRRVTTPDSNGRTGPGTQYPIVTVFQKDEVVFVHETSGGWSRVDFDQVWVSSSLLA